MKTIKIIQLLIISVIFLYFINSQDMRIPNEWTNNEILINNKIDTSIDKNFIKKIEQNNKLDIYIDLLEDKPFVTYSIWENNEFYVYLILTKSRKLNNIWIKKLHSRWKDEITYLKNKEYDFLWIKHDYLEYYWKENNLTVVFQSWIDDNISDFFTWTRPYTNKVKRYWPYIRKFYWNIKIYDKPKIHYYIKSYSLHLLNYSLLIFIFYLIIKIINNYIPIVNIKNLLLKHKLFISLVLLFVWLNSMYWLLWNNNTEKKYILLNIFLIFIISIYNLIKLQNKTKYTSYLIYIILTIYSIIEFKSFLNSTNSIRMHYEWTMIRLGFISTIIILINYYKIFLINNKWILKILFIILGIISLIIWLVWAVYWWWFRL